jgi:hypothetical protein
MMITINETQVEIRRLKPEDFGGLYDYLQNLSAESKKRFGPHSFER